MHWSQWQGSGIQDHKSQQLLIPYVTPEQVMSPMSHSSQEGTCLIASCSSTIDPFRLYGCAHASTQPKQQYAFMLRIPSMLFPTPLQSPSITTQLVEHHTAVTDWPEKKTFPSLGTTNWLAVQQNHERRWSQSQGPLFFFFFFFKVFINSKNSYGTVRIRKHLSVLRKCWISACWHTLLEVSLGTASVLVVRTEKCHGSSRKRLTAQLHCKDFWKEPSAHWSLAVVSLQQAPFAAVFPHAALTLIKLLFLAPGRFCLFLSWDFFFFLNQNCTGSSGEVLTWQSWNCSYFHRASLAC